MTNILKKLTALVFGALVLTTPAVAYESPKEHLVITADGGGILGQYIEKYEAARLKETTYVVDGICASACTLILGMIPADRVCATEFSRFGFHYAYTMNPFEGKRTTSVEGTRMLEMYYPNNVMEKLKSVGWDPTKADDPNELKWFKGKDLGVRECK